MNHLNPFQLDEDDQILIKHSMEGLKKEHMSEMTDPMLTKMIYNFFLKQKLSDKPYTLYIERIISLHQKSLYIVCCALDYGNNHSVKYGYRPNIWTIQVWGYTVTCNTFGRILLRPETTVDRWVDRFWRTDIDLPGHMSFNEKYYLTSSQPEKINNLYTGELIKQITRRKDLIIYSENTEHLIGFVDADISAEKVRFLHAILKCFDSHAIDHSK